MGRRNAGTASWVRAARPGSCGREVTALASGANGWWVLVEGSEVLRLHGDEVGRLGEVAEETGRCLQPVDLAGCSSARPKARLAMIKDGAVAEWSSVLRRGRRAGRPGTRRGEARPTPDRWLARRMAPCSRTSTSAGSSGRRRPKECGRRRSTSTPTSTRWSRTDLDPGHVVAATRSRPRGVARTAADLALRHEGLARAVRPSGRARRRAPVPERLHRPTWRSRWRLPAGAWGGPSSRSAGADCRSGSAGTSTATASRPLGGPRCSGRRTGTSFLSEDGGGLLAEGAGWVDACHVRRGRGHRADGT